MSFADIASDGPLILAVGVSAVAGLVSFLSPCVLPLVPGYVSYVTGLAGADLDAALGTDPKGNPVLPPDSGESQDSMSTAEFASTSGASAGGTAVAIRPAEAATQSRRRVRGRILAGSLLFIAGFTVVFTLVSVLAANLGRALLADTETVQRYVGVVTIVLGIAFLGFIPGLQRDMRIRRLPDAGLVGAPVLGAVFALGWTPCLSPTLGAVLGLATLSGQTGRGVTLGIAYCVGLGLPFLAFALGYRRLLGVFAVIRRNSRWVTRVGGILLILIGIALVTGGWTDFINWLRAAVGPGSVIV
ncbi:MAG TPA: cytochrome c biogenesis protein CcdA [Micromonosporaceae bacterium]|nr:cytochrome c biogenesis protein CcdA [Micromonosporaceae bacterium]